ncbi:MAG: hypothetical protein IPI34_04850 [bacterium]|nr:hypothetical protein [bacterium]
MRPLPSMRAPAQTMSGSAREIFTAWKLLIELQVADDTGVSDQLPPKSVERQTPLAPTAKSRSGGSLVLAILVMKGAWPAPVSDEAAGWRSLPGLAAVQRAQESVVLVAADHLQRVVEVPRGS